MNSFCSCVKRRKFLRCWVSQWGVLRVERRRDSRVIPFLTKDSMEKRHLLLTFTFANFLVLLTLHLWDWETRGTTKQSQKDSISLLCVFTTPKLCWHNDDDKKIWLVLTQIFANSTGMKKIIEFGNSGSTSCEIACFSWLSCEYQMTQWKFNAMQVTEIFEKCALVFILEKCE